MRIICPIGMELPAAPLQADKMNTPFRTDLVHSGRQSSIRTWSRKTVSESQPSSSTGPDASGSEKETVRLQGQTSRSSLTVQAAQAARMAAKEADRRILSIMGSGVFLDRKSRAPVADGGLKDDIDGAGFVFFRIIGSQFLDNGFLDDIGFVPLHGR